MTYPETLEFLYDALPVFQRQGPGAYKPGLERTVAFNDHLGRPDGMFLSIHVAGTNGKGSVSHMLASVLQAAGYRTGLYTSPHLRDFRERIRIDGAKIPEEEVTAFVERHRETMVAIELSFFEMTVGLAFDWFARQKIGIAVIETGLGGRLDATNIVRPVLSVITNVGLDHMSLLGGTIPRIAVEKAGIVKPGVPVVVGEEDARSAPVFREVARREGAPIRFAETMFRAIPDEDAATQSIGGGDFPTWTSHESAIQPGVDGDLHTRPSQRSAAQPGGEYRTAQTCQVSTTKPVTDGCRDTRIFQMERLADGDRFPVEVDLLGDYQRHNVVTALAAIEVLNETRRLTVARRAITEGLRHTAASTGLLGRWQVLGCAPLVVADTGHNEHGIRQIVRQIQRQHLEKLYFVLGVVNDKDLASILPLLPDGAHYLFTQASIPRALPADVLAAEAARYGLHGEVVPGVPEAYARARSLAAPGDMIFIGGSTFTVADLLSE